MASETDKGVARYFASRFQGTRKVTRHVSDQVEGHVDVVTISLDNADGRLEVCSTLGLSNHETGLFVGDQPLGVELYSAAYPETVELRDLMATVSFQLFGGFNSVRPKAVLPSALSSAESWCDSVLPHAILSDPFFGGVTAQEYPDRTVAWLYVLPITDQELALIGEIGVEAVLEKMEAQQIDCLDFLRVDSVT